MTIPARNAPNFCSFWDMDVFSRGAALVTVELLPILFPPCRSAPALRHPRRNRISKPYIKGLWNWRYSAMGSSGGLRRFDANLWSGKSAHQRDFSLFLLVRRSASCCLRPCFLFALSVPMTLLQSGQMEVMHCFRCFFPSVLFVPPRICVRFSDKTLSCGLMHVKLVKSFIYKGFRLFFINIFCLINNRIAGS